MDEQARMMKEVGMKKQKGWEGTRQKKLSWNDIWLTEPQRLHFQLKSVYDVLPKPTNLATWCMRDYPSFNLCGRPANLEDNMPSYSVVISSNRWKIHK